MNEVHVPVRTELTGSQYRALSELAEEHHTTVSSLVRECVRRQLINRPKPRTQKPPNKRLSDEDLAAIRDRHEAGMSDAAIARELGLVRTTVSYQRNAMGLAPLFKGRGKKNETKEKAL